MLVLVYPRKFLFSHIHIHILVRIHIHILSLSLSLFLFLFLASSLPSLPPFPPSLSSLGLHFRITEVRHQIQEERLPSREKDHLTGTFDYPSVFVSLLYCFVLGLSVIDMFVITIAMPFTTCHEHDKEQLLSWKCQHQALDCVTSGIASGAPSKHLKSNRFFNAGGCEVWLAAMVCVFLLNIRTNHGRTSVPIPHRRHPKLM